MKLHVGARNLVAAFHRHRAAGAAQSATNDSHLLLLTYAAECGLKCLLLRQRGLHSTKRLDDDDMTHDLNQLLQKVGSSDRFAACQTDPLDVPITSERLHQAFRYGARLQAPDRGGFANRLHQVLGWLEESI